MALTRLARLPSIRSAKPALSSSIKHTYACHITTSSSKFSENTDSIPEKVPRRKTKVKFSELPGPSSEPLPPWNGEISAIKKEPKEPKIKTRRKKQSDPEINASPKSQESEQTTAKPTKAPTLLAQDILNNLQRFPHCILLTRVGQFYESYFDQANEVASLLNIKLTSRKWGGTRVAMCGFPLIHLDRHLKTLVEQNKKFVAMCEEFPTYDSHGGKEFERRVARIITPGTLIDESFLNPLDNNFLMAVSAQSGTSLGTHVGLAWIDVSTGEFFSKHCPLDALTDELARLSPREVVLHPSMCHDASHPVLSILNDQAALISYTPAFRSSESLPTRPDLIQHLPNKLQVEEENDIPRTMESSAIELLTRFLSETLLEHMPKLAQPFHEASQDCMQIDSHTIQGLEIRENLYERGTRGSLFSVVKRTITNSGTRLLSRWLCAPSTSIEEIERRHALVSFLQKRPHFCADIAEMLKRVDDVIRLCQTFSMRRASFSDIVSLKSTIQLWNELAERSKQEMAMEAVEVSDISVGGEWEQIQKLLGRFHNLDSLLELFDSAVSDMETTEISQSEVDLAVEPSGLLLDETKLENKTWSINPQFSPKLSAVHETLQSLNQEKQELEQSLRKTLKAPSLTLRSATSQGYLVHVARAKRDKALVDQNVGFMPAVESLSTKSYFHRPWTELGHKITSTVLALSMAEKEAFEAIRVEVMEHVDHLRENARVIDELDILLSFAKLATEMNFVRPEMTNDTSFHIVNGRHPVVEIGLLTSGRQFIPNSVEMASDSNLHIITGPNMAGKSTFLRQNALISVLAQVGSFVPADYARIGIVDKVFSRIGARDDLYRDRSTFMVEMLETGHILNRATEKSLIIMDEVGRGTTINDGIAIAFGTLHHLATINRSRCLFATHFHELAELVGNVDNERGSGLFNAVRFFCSDVSDLSDNHYTYSYQLKPGINRDSHGLKVARLAGIPPVTIAVAQQTLDELKSRRLIPGS